MLDRCDPFNLGDCREILGEAGMAGGYLEALGQQRSTKFHYFNIIMVEYIPAYALLYFLYFEILLVDA